MNSLILAITLLGQPPVDDRARDEEFKFIVPKALDPTAAHSILPWANEAGRLAWVKEQRVLRAMDAAARRRERIEASRYTSRTANPVAVALEHARLMQAMMPRGYNYGW